MKNADQPIKRGLRIEPLPDGNRMLLHDIGLTKREYFAVLAMQGLLSSFTAKAAHGGWGTDIDKTASVAIKYADELLKQLEK